MSIISSTQERQLVLSQHKVIPDILPYGLDLSYDLTVKWPDATLEKPAQELDREATQPEPKVYLSPAPSEPLDNLVLILTDPDLMMNNDTYFGQVRHWLVTNLSTSSDGSLSISQGTQVSPYVGPAPLPNYLYSRPHRYIFVLARASGKVDVTPEELRELQKPYVAAMAGKQSEVQDLKDRWGFDAKRFVEVKGLEVVGVGFMKVGGTAKSAVANAALMGQAFIDKVIGK